jgi:hypothetical protein
VALARPTCFYCGAALEGAPQAAPPESAATLAGAEPTTRVLVLLDLDGAEPDTLAEALGVSSYEAGLLARRGGLHLVRALEPDAAEAEAERLRAQGAAAWLVPEAEVRQPPLVCFAGERQGAALVLRTAHAPVTLERGDALLVVRGRVAREYQATAELRRITIASLEEGYRVQIHRRAETPALEIDALNFELGAAQSGSVRLEIDAWLDAVAGDAPRDDAFSRLGPVLGPEAPEKGGGALAAAGSLAAATRSGGGERGRLVLDNVAQFRFYSGCLAAVRRRTLGSFSRPPDNPRE